MKLTMKKEKWRHETLKYCCDILDNLRKPISAIVREKRIQNKQKEDLYPYYGATGQVGWIDDYLIDGIYVLIGEDGAPFFDKTKDIAYLIEGKAWVNNHAHILKAKKDIADDRFILYWLNSFDDFGRYVNGTTRLKLNKGQLEKIPVILPPLDEQQHIVELFQSIEQSIVHAEGQEKNLKSLQKTLSNGLVNNPPMFGDLLEKSKTSKVSFSDIVECVEEHDKKPLEHGLTRFIGLENIESENFNLQGYGNIENGTTFTKRFSKGDVLFGKRRAYLKKVAVADFDGICSGDILVFRAIEKEILPELLPYYVSSDAFINHAVNTSAGSLSPRTKWKDLAGFQLSIPDVKTQEKILDIMRELSQSLQFVSEQKETLKKLKQKLLNEILGE